LVLSLFAAGQVDSAPAPIEIRDVLVLPGRGGRSRTALIVDPVEAARARGQSIRPSEGDTVTNAGSDPRRWSRLAAKRDGVLEDRALLGGYAYARVDVPAARVAILEASGAAASIVNDEPRVGDVYGHGYVHLPVLLQTGRNDLLFQVARGSLRARLVVPPATAYLDTSDATLPDVVLGGEPHGLGAVVVVNASTGWLRGAVLRARFGDRSVDSPVPPLPPLSIRKAAFEFEIAMPKSAGPCAGALELRASAESTEPVHRVPLTISVLNRGETYKRTFVSEIDGSVQYYGVVPPLDLDAPSRERRPGLLLTLHGAGVEGIGQARVYGRKPGVWIVAPTNRRPFGFDWEDWGRLDAIEVLDRASDEFSIDPLHTWLSGHSMGGHGTWHLGVTYPDRFAAIGPSAGWISMMSYGGQTDPGQSDPFGDLMRRLRSPGDTLALAPNLAPLGVYVLHGEADDNVPVDQARAMRGVLGGFHSDFVYYERPGAGHWWGNECVDWPPLVDFLFRHERPRPSAVRRIVFRTSDPGVSARCDWATIETQIKPFALSELQLKYDPAAGTITGTTKNVERLSLELGPIDLSSRLAIVLDGQPPIEIPSIAGLGRVWLRNRQGVWQRVDSPDSALKGPHRSGPFKAAFRNRFQLVIGTQGSPEENAWALARARFDAETFWYRGNGSVDLVRDCDFDPAAEPDRNVILYGYAAMNSAWTQVLADCPVRVERGRLSLGDRVLEGDALGCFFIRPRAGSVTASVGLVAGTGLAGLRTTDRLPIFQSGVAYPDLLVVEWSPAGSVEPRAAAMFGTDWSLDGGERILLDHSATDAPR
jgi:pimeloyl-ACP methyl ester carboxylesterase